MNDALHQLTWVAATAAALGVLMLRLKQPPMLGFMLAGLALGPTGFALVSNDASMRTFAELGVLLLLFVVGLEISLRALRRVLVKAAGVALIQAAAALVVTVVLGTVLRWPLSQCLVIGFVLSLSSTAAGIKLLESVGEARREPGRLAVGVLVAQDVLVIPMLLITAALGTAEATGAGVAARIVIAVGFLVALIAVLSRRERLKLPLAQPLARNTDAGPLVALTACLLGASAASLFGISPVYGAFVAGLVVGASNLRAPALRVSVPVQSILLMVFFLSIGLMLDLRLLAARLPAIVLIAAAVLLARTAVNAIALRLMRTPPRDALIAAVAMAPLGEFGFVLAAAGLGAGALSDVGYQTALAVIAISMAASPLWMLAARRAVEHRETEAATVRAYFAEIFTDELAATGRWLVGAGERLRTGAAKSADLGSTAAGRMRGLRPPKLDGARKLMADAGERLRAGAAKGADLGSAVAERVRNMRPPKPANDPEAPSPAPPDSEPAPEPDDAGDTESAARL